MRAPRPFRALFRPDFLKRFLPTSATAYFSLFPRVDGIEILRPSPFLFTRLGLAASTWVRRQRDRRMTPSATSRYFAPRSF